MTKAKIITVNIEATDTGLLRATSEDMIGLHVVAEDEGRLKELAKEMLCDLFEARGQTVSIYESEDESSATMPPWVVVPDRRGDRAC